MLMNAMLAKDLVERFTVSSAIFYLGTLGSPYKNSGTNTDKQLIEQVMMIIHFE